MAEAIGAARCPLCGNTKARLSLSKQGLPVLTCAGCQAQIFARGDRSDDLMRGLLVSVPAPAVVASPAPPSKVEDPPAAPRAKPASSFLEMFSGGAS